MKKATPSQEFYCPICSGQEFIDFFQSKEVPSQDGVVWPSKEAAINAPRGEVNLVYCQKCAHIFNKTFDQRKITFLDYDFSLHYSSTYQQFNQVLIKALIDRHQLHQKTILEVASGKGHFLVALCEAGDNRGVGIDPSYEKVDDLVFDATQVQFIKNYYTDAYSNLKVDFIVCRHLIDELEQPVEFLTLMKQNLKQNPQSAIYLEVPNAQKTFSKSLIWNIGYAKRSWFSSYSITYLLQQAGYKNIRVEEFLDGDYLGVEAFPDFSGDAVQAIAQEKPFQQLKSFSNNYQEGVSGWQQKLDSWDAQKYKIALWGAGMRGINFLSHFSNLKNLALVIDINPLRQGKYLPKSGFQVRAPEALKEQKVDVILISNATYQNEIMAQAKALGFTGHFEVF
jgi:2-polyprenyl-3-methyl-5-hydroxy-6-metoxy-1,4-benzoquinol methylase